MIWSDAKVRGETGASCRRRQSLNVLCEFQLPNWYIRKKNLWEEIFEHSIPPLVLILSQLKLVHTLSSHFLNIHFNINLPCKPRSSKCVLSFGCPNQSPVFLFHVHAQCPAQYRSWFYSIWFSSLPSDEVLRANCTCRAVLHVCSAAECAVCKLCHQVSKIPDSRPVCRPVCRPDRTLRYQLNVLVSSEQHSFGSDWCS